MYNHEPLDYKCPFCRIISELKQDPESGKPNAVVYHYEEVTVLVPIHWYKNNPGQVLVVPNQHFENIYDLPDEIGAAIFAVSKKIALAMKQAFECEGVSTRQHNEPAGYQDVWHFHQHIFPRWAGDNLYFERHQPNSLLDRINYAEKLRKFL
jgi:histidine triad (HIT) family protein